MKSDSFLEHRPLDELNMSPGSLAKRASNINPVVGIEYEMIMRVPDNRSIKDLTPDFYNDPRVDDIQSIEDFFSASVDAGITSKKELRSAINGLEYDYREYQRQQELNGHDAFSDEDWLWNDRQLKRMSDVYFYVSGFVWPYYQKIMALDREGEYLADTLKPYFPNYNVVSHIDKPAHIDMNYNDFTFVYDYSIKPTGISAKDRPLELVGPKVTLDELHTQYRKVVKWCKQLGNYTNESCGLHMNVSIPNKSMYSVDYVKLVLLLGDQKVLQDFDRLFPKNVTNYCASSQHEVFRFARNSPNEVIQTLKDMRKDMNSAASRAFYSMNLIKNVSVNFRSDRIEFRSPGGDWLNIPEEQIFSTLDRFVVALSASLNPEAAKQEYAKKLYSMLMKSNPNLAGEDDHIKYFIQYATNEIKSPQELKNLLRRDLARKRRETPAQRPSAIQQGIKALDQSDDLVNEEENEEDKPVRIRLSKSDDEDTPAKKFIEKVRSMGYINPMDPSFVIIVSNKTGFVQFDLKPSQMGPNWVHISFMQAHPTQKNLGVVGLNTLKKLAAEDGISLEGWVWPQSPVNEKNKNKLKSFYLKNGFKDLGGGNVGWEPDTKKETRLDEVLDVNSVENLPFRIDSEDLGVYRYTYRNVEIDFSQEDYENPNSAWEVVADYYDSDHEYTAAYAIEFFKIVLSAIKHFIETVKPNRIKFAPASSSHTKLYDRMLQRYLPQYLKKYLLSKATGDKNEKDYVLKRVIKKAPKIQASRLKEGDVTDRDDELEWNVILDKTRMNETRLDELIKLDPDKPLTFRVRPRGDGDEDWIYHEGDMSVLVRFTYDDDEEEEGGGDVNVSVDLGGGPIRHTVENAVKWLRVALSAITQFAKLNQPDAIYFSAPNPSRVKLYDRMIKRYMPKNYVLSRARGSHDNKYYMIARNANALQEARKKKDSGGDCFEAAGKTMLDYQPFSDKGMKLVHAFVSGQGSLNGVRYEHAWNELGDEVIDNSNGRKIRMPKMVYYAIGNINPNNPEEYRMYDMAGLRKMATRFKHWGPWELRGSPGPLREFQETPGDGSGDSNNTMSLKDVADVIMSVIGKDFTCVKSKYTNKQIEKTQPGFNFIPKDPTKYGPAKIWCTGSAKFGEAQVYHTMIGEYFMANNSLSASLENAERGKEKTRTNAMHTALLIIGNTQGGLKS